MTSKQIPAEVTNYVKGFVSDANPMSFPEDASLEEQNFLLKVDGTRGRRLGLDIDAEDTIRTATTFINTSERLYYKSYKWDNVAGIPDLTFAVLQIGSHIAVYNTGYVNPSTSGLIHTIDIPLLDGPASFSSVDGILVIAYGGKQLLAFEYDHDTQTITEKTYRLLIRDLFGVEDVLDGIDYRSGTDVARRPKTLTGNHAYNLRNQTFGNQRLGGGWTGNYVEIIVDPIAFFRSWTSQNNTPGNARYPSNADSVLDALYPNTESLVDPLTDRFHPKELTSNQQGNLAAPRGFFIIDALDRGTSRMSEINKLYADKEILVETYGPTTLPEDSTPTGASVVAEFSGRMFYAGFSSEVVDGDAHSPRMCSYVLFSKLVENYADLKVCYQVGDPTSKDYSEVLDTDGGFVRLEGAYGIVGLVPVAAGLAVIAANGVWLISGEDRGQFKATSYSTSKISNDGCDCPASIVAIGDGCWFWSTKGIFSVEPNQFGDMVVVNKSRGKIQKFFDKIPNMDKRYATGVLDKTSRRIVWAYSNGFGNEPSKELIYNIDFDAFTLHVFGKLPPEPEV